MSKEEIRSRSCIYDGNARTFEDSPPATKKAKYQPDGEPDALEALTTHLKLFSQFLEVNAKNQEQMMRNQEWIMQKLSETQGISRSQFLPQTSPNHLTSAGPSHLTSAGTSQPLSSSSATTTGPSQPPSSSYDTTTSPSQPPSSSYATTTGPSQPPSSSSATTTGPSQPPSSSYATTTGPSQPPSSSYATTTGPSQPPSSSSATTTGPSQPPSSSYATTTVPSHPPSSSSAGYGPPLSTYATTEGLGHPQSSSSAITPSGGASASAGTYSLPFVSQAEDSTQEINYLWELLTSSQVDFPTLQQYQLSPAQPLHQQPHLLPLQSQQYPASDIQQQQYHHPTPLACHQQQHYQPSPPTQQQQQCQPPPPIQQQQCQPPPLIQQQQCQLPPPIQQQQCQLPPPIQQLQCQPPPPIQQQQCQLPPPIHQQQCQLPSPMHQQQQYQPLYHTSFACPQLQYQLSQPSLSSFSPKQSVEEVIEKFYRQEDAGKMAVHLALYYFFGKEVMARNTPRTLDPTKMQEIKRITITKFVMNSPQKDQEALWKKCKDAIGHKCNRLRPKN